MSDTEQWENALAEADALLDTDWWLSDEPGWLYEYGNPRNRKQVPLDVWYLRRAMTIGRGWASQVEAVA